MKLIAIYLILVACSNPKGDGNKSPGSQEVDDSSPEENLQADVPLTPAKPFPIQNFSSSHFLSNEECSRCHNGIQDANGVDVSIQRAWSSSIMAHSTVDPLWRAKVRSEIKRNPQLESIINDKCTRCHAPMANVEAHHVSYEISVFAGGVLDPQHPLNKLAQEGVSCTLCHQIMDSPNLGTIKGISGKFEIESFDNPSDRKIYGPFENIRSMPMVNNVQYFPQYGAHIKASSFCATCHDLKTPFVDAKGAIVSTTPESEFPEQMIYSEWLASSFVTEQSCQDCHMKRTTAQIAARPPGLAPREGFAQHLFVGANVMMLDLLQRNAGELGANTSNIATTISETEKLLSEAATVTIVNPTINSSGLSFNVSVQNQSGHKLPTGFPSRRVFLHIQVLDAAGKIIFESGKFDENGRIQGVDSDDNRLKFEHHHEQITSSDQVQVYEGVMASFEGDVTYTLLKAAKFAKDNRLLPRGFNKSTASNDIKVVGGALSDANFAGGGDIVSYTIPGLTSSAGLTITATLQYQTISFQFGQDLFLDNTEQSQVFQRMYEGSKFKTIPISSTNLQL